MTGKYDFFGDIDRNIDWKAACESAYRAVYGKIASVDAAKEVTTPPYMKCVEQWYVRVSYKSRDPVFGMSGTVVSDTPYVQSEDLLPYCYRDALRMLAVDVFGRSFDGEDEEMMLNFAARGYL